MRIDYHRIAPDAVKAVAAISEYLQSRELDERLRYLLEVRISQINGCSFCIDLHSHQARQAGETQQRLDCLPVWREVPFYTEPERAALAWAESVTLLSDTHVPDAVYEQAREHFTEAELVDLTMVTISMNAWNRLAVSFRKLPPLRRAPAAG